MKLVKFLIKTVLLLFILIVCLSAGLWMTLQTKNGQRWFLKHGITLIENQSGLTIQAKKIEVSFPLRLHIKNLTLSKNQEKLATIQQMDLSCFYPHLFYGRVVCSPLSIEGLTLYSLGSDSSQALPSSYDWIDQPLPFYFKFENIQFKNVHLAPLFIQKMGLNDKFEHYTFDLEGMASNNPLKTSLTTHLLLTITDSNREFSPIKMGIDAQNSQLSLSLHTDQIIIPNNSTNSSLAIYASAPFPAWKNLAKNSPLQENPIEGRFKVNFQDKQIELKSNFQFLSKEKIILEELILHSLWTDLQGSATLTQKGVEQAKFKGDIHASENTAAIQGTIEGQYTNLLLNVHLNSPQWFIQDRLVQNIDSSTIASYQSNILQGKIDLKCESNQIAWESSSDFKWDLKADELHLANLNINVLNSQLKGNLGIHLTDFIVDGQLEANALQLKPIAQLAQLPLEGIVDLKLSFEGVDDEHSIKHQAINGDLIGHAIQWREFLVDNVDLHSHWNYSFNGLQTSFKANKIRWQQTTIENGEGEINWTDWSSNPAAQIKFSLRDITQRDVKIDEFVVESAFSAIQSSWPFRISGRGAFNSPWEMQGEGNWHYIDHLFQLNLNQLNGLYAQQLFSLLQPLQASHQPDKTVLGPLQVKWGESELMGAFSMEQEQFVLDFKTNNLPLALWSMLAPNFPLTGEILANGHLEGTLEQPHGNVNLEFQKMHISEEYLVKKAILDGNVLLKITPQGTGISSQVSGIGRNPFIIKGSLPYKLSLAPFAFTEEESLPLALDIEAEGELDGYLHLFIKDFPNISGQTKLALQLKGKLDKPQIYGSLDIFNATYESQDTGAIYHHIKARLEGDGSKILLKNLSAEDSKGGTIQITGAIDINEKRSFPYQFNIQASQIFILNSDYASISVSGPLMLTGKKKKGKLQGNLQVDRAIVKIEEALPKQIKTLNVNYINLNEGELPPLSEKSSSGIELDIKLNAEEILIEGNHLKSSWKGAIAITGNASQPLLFGDLRIAQGEYDLKGKVFNLTQGSIHFAGSAEKKTTLYVVASKEIDPIRVEMIVKGPLNKLVVSFRSNPSMSQREILSYILFGRGISDISPGEGDSLNQSFISLNASEQTEEKSDLLTRLRNNVGIDRLDITASGEGENKDVALQVGKYIWKDVMISLNKSIGAASDRVSIEAKLMKNVKAEAEMDIGSSSQGKISLKWKRDY